MLLHEYDQAMSYFDQALAKIPGFLPAHIYRAQILARQGKTDQAIQDLQQLLIPARYNLAPEHHRLVEEAIAKIKVRKHT